MKYAWGQSSKILQYERASRSHAKTGFSWDGFGPHFFSIFLSLGRVWKSIGKSRPKVTPGLPKWRENETKM